MKIKFSFSLVVLVFIAQQAFSQQDEIKKYQFISIKENKFTPVKNQAATGTCWNFSTTSLIESELLRKGIGEFDLSEMFIVRNIYKEKARNYILRQGTSQLGPGALGHDLIRGIATYGAMPEEIYSGLKEGATFHNHKKLDQSVKNYCDSILKQIPINPNWMDGFEKILDEELGKLPQTFDYNGKTYTAKSFATDVLKFNADDYINLTSFIHQPYYKPMIIQVPDNFSNGMYYNIPLAELVQLSKTAVKNGFTIMWDADVSNRGFNQKQGIALLLKDEKNFPEIFNPEMEEKVYDGMYRQKLYEDLITQDDHLMHIVGLKKTATGKEFFEVKNSWGEVGNYKGLIEVSEAYFAVNTIALVIPKASLSKEFLSKLQGN